MAGNQAAATKKHELEFTARDFDFIRRLVLKRTGISLAEGKEDLVYGRLAKRLRTLGMTRFSEYCQYVEAHSEELPEVVNAITTNLTAFFRESHHFDYLRSDVLPALLRLNASSRRIRIWSAGCSTGEEPYSIAMVVHDLMPKNQGWDIKILATDIDTNVIDRAASGIYTADRITGIPEQYQRRYVNKGAGNQAEKVRMRDEIRDLITFRCLNLIEEWPMRGPFDLIFCRNVVIYFDKDTQRRLFDRYANILCADGHLFIGHSETLYKVCERFELIGRTIYRKLDGSAAGK
ncbi:MAG: protein-glutamate O-methyltransferase CheR [Chromatiales bacterium]|nr:protein-glutamate O-methyltransferase CheR [Chromatiales bacterium]